jgi:hypothetical protein
MIKQASNHVRESRDFLNSGPVILEDKDVLGQVKSNRMRFIDSIKHAPSKVKRITEMKIGKNVRVWPWILVSIFLSGYLTYILWLKDQ